MTNIIQNHHITDWIFDVDNTLYPLNCKLFDQISAKMHLFIIEKLSLPSNEARLLQRDYFLKYGTTLYGLMIHHDTNPDDYLQYVHDIDYSILSKNPILKDCLTNINGRKFIYTNGSTNHAKNVLQALDIIECFDDFFDIQRSNYIPKPKKDGYEKLIDVFHINPTTAIMVEDMAQNLLVPKKLGIQTALVINDENYHDQYQQHIDFTVTDLCMWLQSFYEKT